MSSRRSFVRQMGVGLAASSLAAESLVAQPRRRGSERLLVENPHHPVPALRGTDRLPLAWYQAQSRRLRDQARSRGVDAILL